MSSVSPRHSNGSLFWPVILISVGVIWLLGNAGILRATNLEMLFRLWPLILIAIGLDILLGRGNPGLRTLIAVGAVALVIILMLVGPALGWVQNVEVKQANFEEPRGDAESALVDLQMGIAQANVRALQDSNQLITADLNYIGEVEFNVSGTTDKTVTLSQKNQSISSGFTNIFGFGAGEDELRWDVALSPDVPMNLTVSTGVGETNLDLRDLKLRGLDVNAGVGKVTLSLPSMDERYAVSLDSGTGEADIRIEEGAALTFTISGGVGDISIDVPDDAAVRLDGKTGVGDISVPGSYQRMDSTSNDLSVGEDGVWQSPNFDGAARQIIIQFNGGVGSLKIR